MKSVKVYQNERETRTEVNESIQKKWIFGVIQIVMFWGFIFIDFALNRDHFTNIISF